MKYKEVKERHGISGRITYHYFEDEYGGGHGESRSYHMNGQMHYHCCIRDDWDYGEVKMYSPLGKLKRHYLTDGKGNVIAAVRMGSASATHTETQLIETAKVHNLPLLSELPKTEAELTLWNLKWPDLPFLPIAPK